MFALRSTRLIQGGLCRNAKASPALSNTLAKPVIASCKYSSDLDLSNRTSKQQLEQAREEIKKDAEILREEFAKTVTPLSVREDVRNESESFIKDYRPTYEYFKNPETSLRSEFPSEFYDKTPRQQEALNAFLNAQRESYATMINKHGESLAPGFARATALIERANQEKHEPVKVCVTGASGQLGYALVFRIASGALFGPNTPVQLSLLELPSALPSLHGVVMELRDCAFPLVESIVATDDADKAFSGVDYALLVGARPRSKGMERGDLLMANAEIFSAQGKALNHHAKADRTRVLVVGNPANTNAMIAAHHAPSIPRENFSAMTRLDHNRGLAQLATKLKCKVDDIERFVIWGNHSATQYPDITHARLVNNNNNNKNNNNNTNDKWLADLITDKQWLSKEFYPTVQKRGAAIIEQRGLSSAASAASAAVDAVADWHFGTNGQWTSAGVCSKGEYGITPGLFYSYPVVYNSAREWDIVRDLPITEASAALMEATHQELLSERDAVAALLK